jgi:hypothetical protein
MNVSEWIKENNVTMTSKAMARRTDGLMNDPGMSHWKCVLTRPGALLTLDVAYSMGKAHTGLPVLTDVLGCVIDDVQGVENSGPGFEGWCAEYGYDGDSRKAEKIYTAIVAQRESLTRWAGSEFPTLMELDRDD